MIIFISGSIHVGKSTVAKLLAEKMLRAAIVEIDTLREMIAWMPIEEAVPINLKNAASVIRNFVESGFDVIVPYPLSAKNYDYMIKCLKDLNAQIFAFTLAPSLDVALSNRGARQLSKEEIVRIKYHYETGIANPSFGEIIDNSAMSAEETAGIILRHINS